MGIFAILLLVVLFLVLYFIYSAYKDRYYFESRGVPYLGNGTIRLVTNMIQRVNFVEDFNRQYKKMKDKNQKVVGTRDFGQQSIMIADLEMLKSVFVKDFDHFSDRREFGLPVQDVLFKKMLFTQKGERWRALRTKLSPTFTTGKIKRLFDLFDQSGHKFVKFLEQEVEASGGELDLSEGYSKFTMDIIASAACGIDSQAFNQKEPSVFEQMGQKLQFKFGGFRILKFIVMTLSPKVAEFFNFSFFEKDMQDFFMTAIKSSINHRLQHKEKGNDFVQLMLEAREGSLKTEENELDNFEKDAQLKEGGKVEMADLLDDESIAANCVLFILAGFDTTQSLLLFCAYALALNQDVQQKLREEIDTVLDDNDGHFTYDALHKMVYLDMVINETLRYYPPAVGTDRGCTMDYKVPGTNFTLKKGQSILVPIYGIHHDEKYYRNPQKFDPERFSPENKHKIVPYSFLPFGQGPRNCIGMRFALTEVKVAISHLVHNFRLEPSKRTLIPMKFSQTSSLKPEGGMFLSLQKISH